jgi:hypothetical protein
MDTVNVPSSTMPTRSSKPGVAAGALVGLMLTIALVAVLYAANALAGTPFVPFDVLDWILTPSPSLSSKSFWASAAWLSQERFSPRFSFT